MIETKLKREKKANTKDNKRSTTESDSRNKLLLLGIIVGACLVVYGASVGFAFTNWDDPVHVLENPDIKSLSAESVARMFSPNERYMYHPLTVLSYTVNYKISALSPAGYHVLNLLLHIGTALLVFNLLLFLFKNNMVALAGTLLFALHPLASEPVCWISGRKDLLFGFFFIAGLLWYLRFTETKNKSNYIFSLLLFTASMLSKPMAASFPLVLFLFDKYFNRSLNGKTVMEKIPFAVVGILIFIVPVLHKEAMPATSDSFSYSFTENYSYVNRILLSINAFCFYPVRFLVPYGLTAYHGFPVLQNGLLPVQYFILPALLVIALLSFFLFRFKITWKRVSFGLLFYLLTIAPVVHLIPYGTNIYLAERYAYIPMLGFVFIFSGYILKYMQAPASRTRIIAFAATAIVIMSFITLNQNKTWKNSLTLWDKNIEIYPEGFYGYFNRGNEFKKQNQLPQALDDYNSSIQYNSRFMEAYYNRGNVQSDLGNNTDAISDFSKAIELNPKYFVAYFNRGNSKAALNNFKEAIDDYTLAINIKPNYEEAYANRGNAKGMLKDYAGSIEDYNQSIKLNPENASAICNRALSKLNLNDKTGACADLQLAAQMGNEPATNLFNNTCR